MDNNTLAFFELVRAGLWEKEARLSDYNHIDYSVIMKLAEEQSVVGLVTAGLERVADVKVPQEVVLQFIGSTLQIEQQNKGMNAFIEKLIGKLREHEVYTLIVKGQGVAQCYERPLWRACGDVDLLLSADNYNAAKDVLIPLANSVEEEDEKRKHLGLVILETFGTSDQGRAEDWVVELHGTLRTRQLSRVNRVVDEAQRSVFYGGKVRSWMNGKTQVFLPAPDEDVVFVFSHIIQHFFGGGIGQRQVCDWCRLLFCYRDKLDLRLLESRIRRMGLMTEWKAFYNLAYRYIGLTDFGEGIMVHDSRFDKKADKVMALILKTGNFGNKRRERVATGLKRSLQSLSRYTEDLFHHLTIFPMDSMKVWGRMVVRGVVER